MVEKHNKTFYLSDGNTFSSLKSFAKNLKDMSRDVYNSHVNNNKNDFANWTNFSMRNEKLAKAIDGQISKLEMELELLRHIVHNPSSDIKKPVVKSKTKSTTSKKKVTPKTKKN